MKRKWWKVEVPLFCGVLILNPNLVNDNGDLEFGLMLFWDLGFEVCVFRIGIWILCFQIWDFVFRLKFCMIWRCIVCDDDLVKMLFYDEDALFGILYVEIFYDDDLVLWWCWRRNPDLFPFLLIHKKNHKIMTWKKKYYSFLPHQQLRTLNLIVISLFTDRVFTIRVRLHN
jgi:hypothetical protein